MSKITFSIDTSGAVDADRGEATGYFRTEGSQIVDEAGNPVQIVGANWFGAEGVNKIPNGLWARNYKDMMDQMAEAGINTIRLPISPDVLDDAPVSGGLYEALNPTLAGKTPIEVIDAIVEYAGQTGMRVFIDMHRIDSGAGKQESGLWYSDEYSLDDLVADWQEVAGRYAGDPTVMGFDLFNEPSGRGEDKAHWGEADGKPESDWAAAAETLGNAVLEVNPDALILVQGVHIYEDKWYWVGGNLKGAGERPIELDVEGRLVYSPHDYPFSVQNVPWLDGATAEEMRELFHEHWGYLAEEGHAPVLIGETGGRMEHADDALYLDTLFEYLGELGAAGGVTWWGWNPNSHDTGGLLGDDWSTIDPAKMAYLEGLDAGMLPSDAYAGVVAETLTADFGEARGHDRIFPLELTARDASGEILWQDVRVLHIPAGESGDDVQVHIPVEVRAAAATLDVAMSYVSGAFKERFTVDLPAFDPGAAVLPEPEPVVPAAPEAPEEAPAEILVEAPMTAGLLAGRDMVVTAGDGGDGDAGMLLSVRGLFDGLDLTGPEGEADRFLVWDAGDLGAGGATMGGASADGSAALEVRVETRASWGDDVLGRVHVTNVSDATIEDWELVLDGFGLDFKAFHKVDGTIAEDGTATLRAAHWMDGIAAGDTLVFGFDARRTGDDGLEAIERGQADATRGPVLAWDGDALGLGRGEIALSGEEEDDLDEGAAALEMLGLDVWGDTFLLRLSVTNTSDAAIDDWSFLLDGSGFDILSVGGGGRWSSDDGGDTAYVEAPSWNGALDVGETARLSVRGELTEDWDLI
jgi:aryl-phospho-beta-D-glucosidase BglC (GH1 family)